MQSVRRTSRLVVRAAIAVLVLLIVGAIGAYFLFNGQRWISPIEQRLSEASGREVRIGALELHLLPMPGIDVRKVTVANPAWARAPLLLQAEQVSVRLAVWPLLLGQVHLQTLTASGVQLDLDSDARGTYSWTLPQRPRTGAGLSDLSRMTALDLQNVAVRYRSARFDDGITRIERLHLDTQPGWRAVRLDALLKRDNRDLIATARLDDLSTLSNGQITLQTGSARLMLDGRMPLQAVLTNAAFKVRLEAERPNDLLAFLNIPSRTIAPIALSADLRESGGKISATAIDGRLGKLQVTGSAQFDPASARPTVDAQLSIPRLDWVQTLTDAGRPPLPPAPPGELFRTHLFPWRVLAALTDFQGTAEVQVASLKTRPGIELTNVSTRMLLDGDQLHVSAIKAGLLDGHASADLTLSAPSRQAHLDLQLHDVSLQKWIVATGHAAPLTGGPIQLTAVVDASGDSMKEMAASLTGPVSIRLGPAVITSRTGAEAEALLTGLIPLFSVRDENRIQLDCVGANLAFARGRASADQLVGARSQASQLLTGGAIDLRQQTLDLRGRVRARSGISLGLSALAGDVSITGPLVKPQIKLDPVGTPSALGRLGAAIVTGGLSIVGTALWDGANPGTDPCKAVFADKPRAAAKTTARAHQTGDRAVP
ncbi:AsmA family protein [Actimicrobium antarcticum]|uniref:AsmA domain-containing protein n=1 Tax=Actimicrobium antarcticum TaxID=1051899 RepID=A0ABP7TZC6_9BURK